MASYFAHSIDVNYKHTGEMIVIRKYDSKDTFDEVT